jgi:hypothetical protein
MKWLRGDDYFQYAEEDRRYTVSKAIDPSRTTYTAWFTPNGVGSWVRLSDPCAHVGEARKAAQDHYNAMQRKAA